MTITNEMVEKAASAYLAVRDYESYNPCIRAALEAVAPMLIAQGMREAAGIAQSKCGVIDATFKAPLRVAEYIRARAQELDPQ